MFKRNLFSTVWNRSKRRNALSPSKTNGFDINDFQNFPLKILLFLLVTAATITSKLCVKLYPQLQSYLSYSSTTSSNCFCGDRPTINYFRCRITLWKCSKVRRVVVAFVLRNHYAKTANQYQVVESRFSITIVIEHSIVRSLILLVREGAIYWRYATWEDLSLISSC